MTVQGESLDMWADSYVFPILLVPRPQSSSLVLWRPISKNKLSQDTISLKH